MGSFPVAFDLLAFDDADELLKVFQLFGNFALFGLDTAVVAFLAPESDELLDDLASFAGAASFLLAFALSFDLLVVLLAFESNELLEDFPTLVAFALFEGGATTAASFPLAFALAFDLLVILLAFDSGEPLNDLATSAAFALFEDVATLFPMTLDLLVFEAD